MQTSSQSHTYSSFIRPVESQGKNTKIEYLENGKSFLDEIKTILHDF